MSEGQHFTKAYKDGLEYIKAKKDYHAKERYLDSVTPSRRGNPITTGTSTSTSGLPVPDTQGNVLHYDAQTTARTGLMFEAPSDLPEVPMDVDKINVTSKRNNPVILTKGRSIVIDPTTGTGNVSYGSSSVLKAPVVENPMTYSDPVMPGMFPSMGLGIDTVNAKYYERDMISIKAEKIEQKLL
ncbi:hypothetical protein PhCBS80983_g06314 [Powellomyces hirtus]|uniref:Uncharacterized protein n=1 Tax=Powellomyces hirtus TaxID=109895 RepID=A0A507DR48_9FUNG|nr:hypothetical protein PhCBS80983_g06314 [Powellomyces hirtus]